METELMAFCRKNQKGGQDNDRGNRQGNNDAVSEVMDASLVEAAWDLDD
jgi:hypothetical protein